MRAAPRDYRDVLRRGGGAREWLWKGAADQVARLNWVLRDPKGSQPFCHVLAFQVVGQTFMLNEERVQSSQIAHGKEPTDVYFHFAQGKSIFRVANARRGVIDRVLVPGSLELDRSILAQRRDPDSYPELAKLASSYERIRIYREWTFGRNAIFCGPKKLICLMMFWRKTFPALVCSSID